MTPKEKAEEMITNYIAFTWSTFPRAKKVAAMAVLEILKLDVWDSPHNAEYGKQFWEEVKNELLKM